MEIKVSNIIVDRQSITPTLIIDVDFEFNSTIEAPLSISGRLLSADNKVISLLNEYQINSDYNLGLRVLTKAEKDKIYREKINSRYFAQLTAVLSTNAIEHIELQREKDQDKSVKFSLNFVIKYLEIFADPQNIATENLFGLQIKRYYKDFIIKHSDWIKSYSQQLGIGKFLLLELQIPDDKKVTELWKELHSNLTQNLKDVENCLRSGDWQKAMFFARKFYENAKIGDNKKVHQEFKNEFSILMTKDQHSEEGINNLLTAIWQLFEFISKYAHEKDRDGNFNLKPIATKEDAYFAYTIGIGFLNLIGRKTSTD